MNPDPEPKEAVAKAKFYRDLQPGELLRTGDQFRWDGEWKNVHPQFDQFPKYVTRGIRHRRQMECKELREQIESLETKLAETEAERDNWRRRYEEKDKPARALGENIAALAAENARLRELLSDCENTFANGPHRDNPIRQNIQKALSTKGGDEICAAHVTKPVEQLIAHSTESEQASNAAPESVPTVSVSGKCMACDGTGEFESYKIPCPKCGGSGKSVSGNEATPETYAKASRLILAIRAGRIDETEAFNQSVEFANTLEVSRNTALRELAAAKHDLDSSEGARDLLRFQLAAAQETIAQLRKELHESRERILELEGICVSWVPVGHKLADARDALHKELSALRADLERKEAALRDLLLAAGTFRHWLKPSIHASDEYHNFADACDKAAALTPTPETQEGAR
jgi:regulator of replication initiation timing